MTAHAGTETVATNAEAPGVPGRLPIAGHILKWRKDPVAHPIWTPPEPGPRGLHPVSGRPLRQ